MKRKKKRRTCVKNVAEKKTHTLFMSHFNFYEYIRTKQKLPWGELLPTAEVCLKDMEQGLLPTCVRDNDGRYLWSALCMSVEQWIRLCNLGPPPSLLWVPQSYIVFTLSGFYLRPETNPETIAALGEIEYLWQDLDAAEAFLHSTVFPSRPKAWIAAEVQRRRQWMGGLRRAWLAVVTK
jgi:hypothetical protein